MKPQTSTKKVKAWAIINKRNIDIINENPHVALVYRIYFYQNDAKARIRGSQTVVPVMITYSLPITKQIKQRKAK